jgi:hypothetical protein
MYTRNEALFRINQLLKSSGVEDADELSQILEIAVPPSAPILDKHATTQTKLAAAGYAFEEAKKLVAVARRLHEECGVAFDPHGIDYQVEEMATSYWESSSRNC